MPSYILLPTLTAEGRKTVKNRPEQILEVDREIEALGLKVLSQHAVLDPTTSFTWWRRRIMRRSVALRWS